MASVVHFDFSPPEEELDTGFEPEGDMQVPLQVANERAKDFGAGEDELREYAKYLGIRSHEYDSLKPLAQEGLDAPLPKGWEQCKTPEKGERRYYHNVKSNRSQWEHPLDEVYKEKVELARRGHINVQVENESREGGEKATKQKSYQNPKVLGDLTNSNNASRNTSIAKRRKQGKKKKKILPPLRLAPLDLGSQEQHFEADLSQQNPLYQEHAHGFDSEPTLSTSVSTSGSSFSSRTRKALKQRSKGNKRSPRELRMREVSEGEATTTTSMTGTDSESNSISRCRSGSKQSWAIRSASAAMAQDSSHSPSSSSGSSNLLSPREPGNGKKKKKGSPRRIEKLNSTSKPSSPTDPDSSVKSSGEATTMSKSKSKLYRHQELAAHIGKAETRVREHEAHNPVQLQLVIDVDEDEAEKITKEDLLSLKETQVSALQDLKQHIKNFTEEVVERSFASNNSAKGANVGATKQTEASINGEEASLLKQLKGEIDLISDYYSREERAKKERDALLEAHSEKLKNSLQEESKTNTQLKDTLERTKEEARKENNELRTTIESQKNEIESLISRVSESSKDKFQMAENFNKIVADQKDEMLRKLNKIWDKVKDSRLPESQAVVKMGNQNEIGDIEGSISKEFDRLSQALSSDLAEKHREILKKTEAHDVQVSALIGKFDKVVEAVKASQERMEENILINMSKHVESNLCEVLTKHQLVAERKQSENCEAVSKMVSEGLVQFASGTESQHKNQTEDISRVFSDALGQCQQAISSELASNHQVSHDALLDISNKIEINSGKQNEKAYLTSEDLKEELKTLSDRLTEEFLRQEDILSRNLLERETQSLVLKSEACQTEDEVPKGKQERKVEDEAKREELRNTHGDDDSVEFTQLPNALMESLSHSKKQLNLLKKSMKASKAKTAMKEALRQGMGSDSLEHKFETYLRGIKASSKTTEGIQKYLKRRGMEVNPLDTDVLKIKTTTRKASSKSASPRRRFIYSDSEYCKFKERMHGFKRREKRF